MIYIIQSLHTISFTYDLSSMLQKNLEVRFRKQTSRKGALAPPDKATGPTETILSLTMSLYLMRQK